MQLFLFSSTNEKNFQIGQKYHVWGIPQKKDQNNIRTLETKASKINKGDVGIFYMSKSKYLTSPFVFLETPQKDSIETELWDDGTYMFCFNFSNIVNKSKKIGVDMLESKNILKFKHKNQYMSPSCVFNNILNEYFSDKQNDLIEEMKNLFEFN
ncbi:hypothetical protein BJI49_11740 [Acetobacter pasteurianus]|uniref:Uncharacterized protein n=1 Tax=Acetobacter pasteurianus TaxID=438 RepID=A0A1A0D6Q8_ACEPA|nr:hypothetical protein [Acetobacter pasteurianus]OAZ70844.1 hypothetical protein SRCM100623_02195 [Acetobacter pasteurianus]RCL05008.1 hypothetical protein BJI49_11740 [Acetobacter pasteurianus]GAB30075.1 hypothetical protein APS_0677 [Acetobacter pasteurianus subsp. pasteurianus LMG 1262 = NBRC 106471]GCD48895.1 hypothetical protein NBRC106471_0451 [Acetobacter pasteurianus subsp. pasteurianus LMG 1262 = NBRC 106471]